METVVNKEQHKHALARFVDGVIHHETTKTSNITTNWGVNWDEEMIARDLLQNFFDANRDALEKIVIAKEDSNIFVTAPAVFPLDSLFYLGSNKSESDIGQYGEGFKAAAMCLLRDHGVSPVVISGDRMVQILVSEEPVEVLGFRCLVYHYYSLDQAVSGTKLILQQCPPALSRSMVEGISHFFSESNSLIGNKAWHDSRGHFALYASTTKDGYIFYNNLRRGIIAGFPLVMVISKTYADIEKKIQNDRDRNAFGEGLLDAFYRVFARYGIGRYDSLAVVTMLQLSRSVWDGGKQGHPLLEQIARVCQRDFVQKSKGYPDLFGDRFFAASWATQVVAEQMRRQEVEQEWKQTGRKQLPAYFTEFGVVSAEEHLRALETKAREEARHKQTRPPTVAEDKSLQVLRDAVRQLAPTLHAVLLSKRCHYTVAETEALQGEFTKARTYNSLDVFLAMSSFETDFGDALALFLHEHAHIFGYDGSRGFTDALTTLIATIVRHRDKLTSLEEAWNKQRTALIQERENNSSRPDEVDLLEGMKLAQLREILRHVSPLELKRAVRNVTNDTS